MQSGQKQVVLGKGEKERERRKEKKKEKGRKKGKKRRKRERKRNKGEKKVWGKQSEIKKENKTKQNKKKTHGGVSSDSLYFKSLDFPWNWSVSLVFWGRGLLC